nr:reverse transcriptase domain-containing protein [Tanacetum cinerariifolium]
KKKRFLNCGFCLRTDDPVQMVSGRTDTHKSRRMEFTYALRFRFDATNNKAEYEALIAELKIAKQMGVKKLQANVDSRFGLPREIISDNGKQFRDDPFKDWCEKLSVILTEIGMPMLRTAEVDLVRNNEALEIKLDLLAEKREEAAIREAKSKAKMKKYYNSKVRNTSFKPGDLVYRNNDASRAEDTRKLGPKWEGPYEVMEVLRKGAYKLRDCDRKQLSRTWNIRNLKKCYIHKIFGLPREIISDNGKQFRDDPFKDWCEKLCIRQHFASVKHLQTNGLVERAKRSLGEGIKARLNARSKN